MNCPNCSENVIIQTEQVAAKTKVRKNGCLWSMGRFFLVFFTPRPLAACRAAQRHGKTNYAHRTLPFAKIAETNGS